MVAVHQKVILACKGYKSFPLSPGNMNSSEAMIKISYQKQLLQPIVKILLINHVWKPAYSSRFNNLEIHQRSGCHLSAEKYSSTCNVLSVSTSNVYGNVLTSK